MLRLARSSLVVALSTMLAPSAAAQDTIRVSLDENGNEGDADSGGSVISADGRLVAFSSAAALVTEDTNGCLDVYVVDRVAGTIERVSVDSWGNEGDGDSGSFWSPSISGDGRFVAFSSYAKNLVFPDTNGREDVFVHDRSTGVTERVSVDSAGGEANGWSTNAAISADGLTVAYVSVASNLVAGDTNHCDDVFVHDRGTGDTERVSVDSLGNEVNAGGYHVALSADGNTAAFYSDANDLVPGDTNLVGDVFVHDRVRGTTERVSVGAMGIEANDNSDLPFLSGDGQIVVFSSGATNLVSNDTNGAFDVFVRDRSSATTSRVNLGPGGVEADQYSVGSGVSSDGRAVAFYSLATNLVGADTNGMVDAFLADTRLGTVTRVSVDSAGAEADGPSSLPVVSADRQFVTFTSSATNLVSSDGNGVFDVFVRDARVAGSWTNYGAGVPGTNGIPTIGAQSLPVIGTTVTVDVSDSSSNATVGLLLVGSRRDDLKTRFGGDLLVAADLFAVVAVPVSGYTISGALPFDDALCGATLCMQMVQADAGAPFGASFTPGLELVIGR